MTALQKNLLANALFSLGSGLILCFTANPLAHIFGLANHEEFLFIGGALLLFSSLVFLAFYNQNKIVVVSIIIQDLLWVFGSIWILVSKPFGIASGGQQIIAVVATIVLFFAVAQSQALAQSAPKLKTMKVQRIINAPKIEVWAVVSDVANYHLVAPNLDDVKILSGEGEGMLRSCSHGDESWTETCTLWQEGEQYEFEVNTMAADYPYPFQYLKGSWKLIELGPQQTLLIMTFEFTMKKKVQNLMLPFLKPKFRKLSEELLSNWQREIEH